MRKKYVLVIAVIVILSGLAFIGYQIYEQRSEEARMVEEQKEIEEAYRWFHYAISILCTRGTGRWDLDLIPQASLERGSVYRLLDSINWYLNEHGIFWWPYLILRMYYHRGGVYLSYEILIDYLSEEFEPDGTLRLYNNGNHPEIEAFVVWMREGLRSENRGEFDQYLDSLDNRDEGFRISNQPFRQLSPQMFDALARAEADPDYILDLTSLQEAGY